MKKFGLLGKNLKYSYSKYIHDFFIEYYNIQATYNYIEQEEFNFEILYQYDGLNITIPYKQTVVEYLDTNNSPIEAINTLVNDNGKLTGYNTDIIGFGLLVEKLNLKEINEVVVLGSGATALMVKEYFKNKDVIIISRSDEIFNYSYLNNIKADLLVNTTPVGMSEYKSPINEELLSNYQGVIDLNYNPLNSKLALDCKKKDLKFINGLYMLIKQAAMSFEIWHAITIKDEIIELLYYKLLFKVNKKIALIGMPLSGKSTIIKKYHGYDLDNEVERAYKKSIPTMLENNTFRDYETVTLEKLVYNNVDLIALGGGCILKLQNIELLKDYLLIYLEVDLNTLKKRLLNSYRPLLKSENDLENTYNNRKAYYEKYANVILDYNKLEEILNENCNN